MYFVEQNSPEWNRMWEVIKSKFGDYACEENETGEVWQYMGTENKSNEWQHCFRHRCLPAVGHRIYFRIPASRI